MAIDTLSVVNDCLGLLGEVMVNDLDVFHPMVPRAKASLSTMNSTVQAKQWYFNTEYVTLTPQQNTGEILVPNDTLSADTLTEYPRVAVRGRRLYNLDKASYQFDEPVSVWLHREVPFDELPMLARSYISLATQYSFQFTIDADSLKTRQLADLAESARIDLNAEHIRFVRANRLNTPSVAIKLGNIRGNRRPNYGLFPRGRYG